MKIKRDDLAAAAAAGLLHHSQIDPLLVYLLQRDVRAKRLALAAQAQARAPGRNRLQALLWYTAVFMAVLTAGLFAMLHASRIAPAAGLVLVALLYGATAAGFAAWSRNCGYGKSLRIALGVMMASVPLAVFALHDAV